MNKVDVVNVVTTQPGLPASPFGQTNPGQTEMILTSIEDRRSSAATITGRQIAEPL